MRAPFLILQTGRPAVSMRRHGSFAHWIRVAAGLADDDVVVVDVAGVDGNGGDSLPTREGFAGVFVTGSAAMVTERLAWSEASAAWLRDAAHAGLPLLGICYGHQLLAHALGGSVGYNPAGREMGTVDIDLTADAGDDPLFTGLPSRFAVQATHLQTVLALPEGARLLATSRLDAAGAFRWGQRAWGVQFHPEFSTVHMRGYVRARREALASEGLDATAMEHSVRATPRARQLLRRFELFPGENGMSTRAVGPGRGWGWLQQAINLGRNNPRAIFGATALMAIVVLIPSVVQLVLQYVFKESQTAIVAVMVATMLLSMVVTPLLIGGLLRVIHAAENGQSTHATAIFDTFRASEVRGRLIGFGVLMMAIYLGVFFAVLSLFGQDFMRWYWELITSAQAMQSAGGTVAPPTLAEMPEGLGRIMGIGSLFALFMGGVYAIGFGQVALGGRRVGEAFVDGLRGTVKNVLPIVVLAILSVLAMVVLTIGVVLVAGIITLVVGLASKTLALALLVPIYFAMILLMYVVMFGVMYFIWRDICSDATPVAPRMDQLEV